jgi:hypothetical protein
MSAAPEPETDPEGPGRQALLVLGMHRSGTSATAGLLALLGAAAPRTLEPANAYNSRGYWESRPLMAFHNRLLAAAGSAWSDWRPLGPEPAGPEATPAFAAELRALLEAEFGTAPLIVVKDPRISRVVPFWRAVLAGMGIAPRVVLPLRDPREVAASLADRDGMPPAEALLLWLRHVLDAEAESRALPRCLVRYEALLGDWRAVAARIARRTGLALDLGGAGAAAVDAFLDADLRHHRADGPGGGSTGGEAQGDVDALVPGWVAEAEAALALLAAADADPGPAGSGSTGPGTTAARARLDAVRRELDTAARLFGPLLRQREAALAAARAEAARLPEAEAAKARAEADAAAMAESLGGQLGAALGEVPRLAAALRAQDERAERLAAEARDLLAHLRREAGARAAAEARAAALAARLAAIEASLAWRLTRPLRGIPAADPAPGPAHVAGTDGVDLAAAEARLIPLAAAATAAAAETRRTALDPDFYARRHPDVGGSGMSPLAHYLRFGRAEGRVPNAAAETSRDDDRAGPREEGSAACTAGGIGAAP